MCRRFLMLSHKDSILHLVSLIAHGEPNLCSRPHAVNGDFVE